MKQAQIVEEILLFIEKIMEQEPSVRREIMRLLKKHFDRFKKELLQVLSEGGENISDEETKESDFAMSGHKSRQSVKSTSSMLALLKSSRAKKGDMAILKEIFDRPLSTRDFDDRW